MEKLFPPYLSAIIMTKKHLLLLIAPMLLFSCKPSKKELITRKWQAVGVQSGMLDNEIKEERHFIDTIGTTTSPAQNLELYGVSNMDSMRKLMHKSLDSTIASQEETIKNTWLLFDKNGTVVTHFGAEPDTVAWYFDDDGALMLDEMKHKGAGSKIKMNVLKLTDKELQLQFEENGFSSTASFVSTK